MSDDIIGYVMVDIRVWAATKAEIERLREQLADARAIIAAKLLHRRCHDCGYVGYYTDATIPECDCEQCGSHDTRRVKESVTA